MDQSVSVLLINSGSSSVRLSLFQGGSPVASAKESLRGPDVEAMEAILSSFLAVNGHVGVRAPSVVGHRVVHGGSLESDTAVITEPVEREILNAAKIAPLHNPVALRWLAAARKLLPNSVHAAVFDTGFFTALPAVAREYALPSDVRQRLGALRYGFHGLAHEAMARAAASTARRCRRAITLQLGSGCSASALLDGAPIDTSMGFSPLEGLIMGTRCGDIDAGVVLALCEERGATAATVRGLLSEKSGLLGISGHTSDMKELLSSKDERSALAVEMFCYRVAKYVGAFTAALGGLDVLVFGGGIGENAALVRSRIMRKVECLGVLEDPTRNELGAGDAPAAKVRVVSSTASAADVLVCEVDEASIMFEKLRSVL